MELIVENNVDIALGIIPFDVKGTEGLSAVPIVCVFPEDVWPYAKIVILNPKKE